MVARSLAARASNALSARSGGGLYTLRCGGSKSFTLVILLLGPAVLVLGKLLLPGPCCCCDGDADEGSAPAVVDTPGWGLPVDCDVRVLLGRSPSGRSVEDLGRAPTGGSWRMGCT